MTVNVINATRCAGLTASFILSLAIYAQGQIDTHEHLGETCYVASGCSCLVAGCRGPSCMAIQGMWEREPAAGNESQHFSYDTRRLYYYRRPYNAAHVREARQSTLGMNEFGSYHRAMFDYRVSAELFRQVNRDVVGRFRELPEPESIDGGHLEYVDWQDHQRAKEIWEQNRLSESGDAEPQVGGEPASILQSHLPRRTTNPLR